MVGMLSDIGNIRKVNEDYIGFHEDHEKRVYVIADGVGGHNAGEVASKLAVENTIRYINAADHPTDIQRLLREAIIDSNSKIYELAKQNSSYSGMGTTITLCLIKDRIIHIANIGDSSCFILKEGNLLKVTKDHSLVQQLVDSGDISEEEALVHPNRNVITRALGTNAAVEVDLFTLDTAGVERVILCTDGLTDAVSSSEIKQILTQYGNDEACARLVELSKERGGRDNISVIVFEGEVGV